MRLAAVSTAGDDSNRGLEVRGPAAVLARNASKSASLVLLSSMSTTSAAEVRLRRRTVVDAITNNVITSCEEEGRNVVGDGVHHGCLDRFRGVHKNLVTGSPRNFLRKFLY